MDTIELAKLMLAWEPVGASGSFSSVFSDGHIGERGTYLFLDMRRWAVRVEGAATLWSTGGVQHVKDAGGTSSGTTAELPQRPPWSLLIPRLAVIYGRPGDDWTLDEVCATAESTVEASLSSGVAKGHVVVDLSERCIVELATPAWTASAHPGLALADRRLLERLLV